MEHSPPPIYESKHPTLTNITKYEYTRLRGFRLEQLANGAIPYIHVPDIDEDASDFTDEPMTLSEIEGKQLSLSDIFNKEAYAGVLPFQVQRADQTAAPVDQPGRKADLLAAGVGERDLEAAVLRHARERRHP